MDRVRWVDVVIVGIGIAAMAFVPGCGTQSSSPSGPTAGSCATLAISQPNPQHFATAGGNGTVSVTAPSACLWTVVSNNDWIVPTAPALNKGSGNGTVTFKVLANGAPARAGTTTIGSNGTSPTFMVTQDGLVDLSGRWSGNFSDVNASGPESGQLTWQLTQSGSSVTGTFSTVSNFPLAAAPLSGVLGSNGTTLTFTMGPIAIFQCVFTDPGSAEVTATTITGTYTGSTTSGSACQPVTNGTFSLTKQLGPASSDRPVWLDPK